MADDRELDLDLAKWTQARHAWECQDCGAQISGGDMHVTAPPWEGFSPDRYCEACGLGRFAMDEQRLRQQRALLRAATAWTTDLFQE